MATGHFLDGRGFPSTSFSRHRHFQLMHQCVSRKQLLDNLTPAVSRDADETIESWCHFVHFSHWCPFPGGLVAKGMPFAWRYAWTLSLPERKNIWCFNGGQREVQWMASVPKPLESALANRERTKLGNLQCCYQRSRKGLQMGNCLRTLAEDEVGRLGWWNQLERRYQLMRKVWPMGNGHSVALHLLR